MDPRTIPDHIWLRIFSYNILSPFDLHEIRHTCLTWESLLEDERFWKKKWKLLPQEDDLKKEFDDALSSLGEAADLLDYEGLCVRYAKYLRNIATVDESKYKPERSVKSASLLIMNMERSECRLLNFWNKYCKRLYFEHFNIFERIESNSISSINETITEFVGNALAKSVQSFPLEVQIGVPLFIPRSVVQHLVHQLFDTFIVNSICVYPFVKHRFSQYAFNDEVGIQNGVGVGCRCYYIEICVVINGEVTDRWCCIPFGYHRFYELLFDIYNTRHKKTDLTNDVHDYASEMGTAPKTVMPIRKYCWLPETRICSYVDTIPSYKKQPVKIMFKNSRRVIKLDKEQFLAPEMWYQEIDLPGAISSLLHNIPHDVKEKCLSHILLMGDLFYMPGFHGRFATDLSLLFKDCSGAVRLMYPKNTYYEDFILYQKEMRLELPNYKSHLIYSVNAKEYILHGLKWIS